MKNILIITSSYCGKASANGLCTKALVKELEESGVQVYVISSDKEEVSNDNESRVFSIHNKQSKKSVLRKGKVIKVLRFLKKVLLYTWTPNYDKALVHKFLYTGKNVFNKAKIDCILCMYFPLEAVVAGYLLKKIYSECKFIIYELDSMADGIGGAKKWNGYLRFAYKRIMQSMYKWADLIMILKCHEEHWFQHHCRFIKKVSIVDLPILRFVQLPKTICFSFNLDNGLYIKCE